MGTTATKESKYYPEFERNEIPVLHGKVVAITGCTTGTGYVAAQCAARKGAEAVLMLNRPSERATSAEIAVKEQIPNDGSKTIVETIPCDLQDLSSVQEAIRTIKSKYDKIDVLCNNAGVMALEDVATKDGYDIQMQTNHLSHFLLTKELLPLIQKSTDGRIVNHSSMRVVVVLCEPNILVRMAVTWAVTAITCSFSYAIFSLANCHPPFLLTIIFAPTIAIIKRS